MYGVTGLLKLQERKRRTEVRIALELLPILTPYNLKLHYILLRIKVIDQQSC